MLRSFLVLGMAALSAKAESLTFSSGAQHVALIELFTSEGCSSCPPAERWLAMRRTDPQLWKTFVPVSWHVDYWNRLGWPDRFSTREFTQREYDYAATWRSGTVYTPCFVRDGAEWRPTSETMAPDSQPVGRLAVSYDGQTIRARFSATRSAGAGLELHAVLLGGGIESKVTGGENAGSTLEHEFVALKSIAGPLDRELPLQQEPVKGVSRYALAAWVTHRGSLASVQATGGWWPAK